MKYFKALLTRSLEQTMIAKQRLENPTFFIFI